MGNVDPKERLIFALDVPTAGEAERYVDELDGIIDFFKVGIILHSVAGSGFVRELVRRGKKVFLDLKFLDIADTVRDAVRQVSGLGVTFLTVHAERQAMKAAAEGRAGSDLRILAVTLLTNLGISDLEETGIRMSPGEVVLRRARMAAECGCDGVISSGREAALIRKKTGGRLLIVTPGVRPAGSSSDGHKRLVTPSDAIRAGADYLVVGRPIRNAADRRSAASSILEEMRSAFQQKE